MNTLDKLDVRKLFEEHNALLSGHFLLASGRHADSYLQCAQLLQYPEISERLGEALAQRFASLGAGVKPIVDIVLSPALGGIILGHVVARAFHARAIFAERVSQKLELRRAFKISKGDRVLLVEDVLTTGGSVRELTELVNALGGRMVGLAAVAERRDVPFPGPKAVLLRIPLDDKTPEDCSLCQNGVPLVKPGHPIKLKTE
jgi:orotate phosphoribosyltransferase